MGMQLLDDLRDTETELAELGKGHLASIRNDAGKLLPPLDLSQADKGQVISLSARAKGASHLTGNIVRAGSVPPNRENYGRQVTVLVKAKRELDVPVAGMGQPKKEISQQTVEVRFNGDNFEIDVDGQCLWIEQDGKVQILPGALPLIVQRLIAVSAFLREESNPRVIWKVEKAQQAIRDRLNELGAFQWNP
jgi:hypothetical protein